MRIERAHDWRPAGGARIVAGARDDGAVAEMHAIEDADGEKERPGKTAELGDGGEDVQAEGTSTRGTKNKKGLREPKSFCLRITRIKRI
jgi:hypothetical protein